MKEKKSLEAEEKTTAQKSFDLEAEISNIEAKIVDGLEGIITVVEDMTNETFFGSSETVEVKNGISVTIELENGLEISQWFNREIDPRGYQKSNIYLFKQAYKSIPKEGLKVKAILIDGFYRIKF